MGKTVKPSIMEVGHSSDFQTPPSALDPLLPFIPPHWTIWECAAGKGHLVNALRARGHEVIASDILTGQDFFLWQPSKPYDLILTNLPFDIKDQFLTRAYFLRKPFAFLMRDSLFDSRLRRWLFREFGIQFVLLPGRVKFTTPSGKVGGSWFYSMWACHGLNLPQQIVFPEE